MPTLAKDDLFDVDRPRGDGEVVVDGVTVPVTSLDRVYFSAGRRTKADLLRYYHRVAPTLLPHLRDRPMILKRFPQGAGGPHFFQHDAGEVPDFVRTARIEAEARELDYIIGGDEPTLIYCASRGSIECHTWHSTLDDLDHPDRMVIDLDPGPGVSFKRLCEVALTVRDVLREMDLKGYPKTSGSRGIHVFVPLNPRPTFDGASSTALECASIVVDRHPKHTTLERVPADRPKGTIYVDFLQNARSKSVASPYSVRAKPKATVSTPLTWDEVEAVPDPTSFTIDSVPGRIAQLGDLYKGML